MFWFLSGLFWPGNILVPSLSVSVKKYLFVIDSSQYEFDVGTYINICYPLQVHCRHNNIVISARQLVNDYICQAF